MTAKDIVVNLIALYGGKLVGRTRLQKQAYLLHRCGGNFKLNFVYHHYGPYSFALADGLTDALAEGQIEIDEKPGRYGIQYAIFSLTGDGTEHDRIGGLSACKAGHLLKVMKDEVSDIVLEIAATILYLRDEGGYKDQAVTETKIRKPLKATEQRIRKAHSLLGKLGLHGTW